MKPIVKIISEFNISQKKQKKELNIKCLLIGNKNKGDIMENKEKVIKAFKDSEEPLNATKVSQISGVEKKEVDKIMKELKKDETIYSPKRCYYALKE